MLKNRMFRIIGLAGRHFEQTGQWEKASEYYLQGPDIEDLAEELARCLMICCKKSGNMAAAVKVYDRCRCRLRVHLGIGPSAETESDKAIFFSLFYYFYQSVGHLWVTPLYIPTL